MDESKLGLPNTVVPLPAEETSDETTALRPATLQVTTNGSVASSISVSTASCLEGASENRHCLIVGRQAATADLRIQHGSISRQHAVLFYTTTTAQLCVMDLGSKKGTHVNGTRIAAKQPVTLTNGDQLVFGTLPSNVFTVQLQADNDQSLTSKEEDAAKGSTATTATKEEQPTSQPSVVVEENNEPSKPDLSHLSAREQRQAEIAAMVASLDETPTYQAPPPPSQDDSTKKGRTSKEESALQSTARKHRLPVTETLTLLQEAGVDGDSIRRTTCMAMDASGGRFVVASRDSSVRFYDFGGMGRTKMTEDDYTMDADQACFATISARDGYPCAAATFSTTGDSLIVATTSVQPKIFSRDGQEIVEFVRGDMYVTDQTKTVGHTAAVTSVAWHPLERSVVLTGSCDGSVRLWNIDKGKRQFDMLTCEKVFPIKNARGQRAKAVTAACFHPGGREFAVGTDCGSIQIWNTARVAGRPERAVYDAHDDDDDGGNSSNQSHRGIHSLAYNVDGSLLVSRSSDGETCKVWNAKRLSRSSRPVVTCRGVPTVHEGSNAVFSPDGRIVCAGASVYRQDERDQRVEEGSINFFKVPDSGLQQADASVCDPFLSLPVDIRNTGPVIVRWHPKLNQILAGCSNGSTIIYYDPKLSSKGALLVVKHKASRKRVADRGEDDLQQILASRAEAAIPSAGAIFTPLSQPRNRGGAAIVVGDKKRKREERKDPVKSREPERPVTDKHKTGTQLGGALNFQQFVSDQTMEKSKVIAGKDPREALFSYKEGKSYVSVAYEGNEERILAEKTAEEEEAEMAKKKS